MIYRREIDGLRALAVLPVIFFHAGFRPFSGGYVGVDVFFVISGYLITSLILSGLQTGTFSLTIFYERRVRRILPALFVVMLACLPFAWLWMLPSDLKAFSKSLVAVSAFASNILFWREGGYFATAEVIKPLFHTWSLAVEEQYYLLYPMLLILISKLGKRWIATLLGLMAIASFGAAEWGSKYHPQGAFYLLPTRGWELLIGASVALHFLSAKPMALASRHTASFTNEATSALGLLLIAYAILFFDRNIPYPGYYALVPTLGTALVILCANPHTLVGRLLNTSVLVTIGLISYSAYLWHQPLFAFARIRNHSPLSVPYLCALSAAALGCAYVTWRYVELPFRNRVQIQRTTVVTAAGSLASLFIFIGIVGYKSNGLAYRFSSLDRDLAAFDTYEAGQYVERRFTNLEMRPFDMSDRKKVLVVGDSYAQDVINAAFESGLTTKIQLSTHYIPKGCGNLFLDRSFLAHIEKARQSICEKAAWYDDAALRSIMSEADAIWLASKWTPWEVELVPDSVRYMNTTFRGQILIFGPKSFGRYTIADLLKLSVPQRVAYRSVMPDSQVNTNEFMKSSLREENFLDVSALMCDSGSTCPLFTNDGKLISFDGQHLTKDGAAYFGRGLAASLSLRGFFATR